jgi:RimJ/RimL family protein N-acetyltransferase
MGSDDDSYHRPMTDERVSLRPFAADDAAAVHRWFNNPRATQSLMEQRDSFSPADAQSWTNRAMDRSGEDRKFAVLVRGIEEPVGFTALYGLFRTTAPELGVLIGDPSSSGIGRHAEALTIARAFGEFGAHRVYGRIPAGNRAAKWVVESLGWKREAIMRGHLLRGDRPPEDCEIWGVLPSEFRAATADPIP